MRWKNLCSHWPGMSVQLRRNMQLQHWSEQYSADDESLAIDGKTMRSAIDSEGRQIHIMSAIGHNTLHCYTQKKS